LDDLRKIAGRRNRGLRAGPKLALTAVVAVLVLLFANHGLPPDVHGALLRLGELTVHAPLPLWFALGVLALVATAHGVNLTDGLDGLAAGTMLPPLAVVAVLAWRSGIPGVAFADAALAASVLGFLAFNRHPASVFMGDTGSLALGAALATSAVLAGESLLLPLVGGVFAAEALSVIVQVAYFKKTHKRIFRMSPLHHHFELGGLAETTVTHRFWTASALLSLAGLALAR
ncbi:MAG: phospho-N-acetylmuramoyl-pentapeptide-transferase, partial [Vulcanimicrobiaceae bacterium]